MSVTESNNVYKTLQLSEVENKTLELALLDRIALISWVLARDGNEQAHADRLAEAKAMLGKVRKVRA